MKTVVSPTHDHSLNDGGTTSEYRRYVRRNDEGFIRVE